MRRQGGAGSGLLSLLGEIQGRGEKLLDSFPFRHIIQKTGNQAPEEAYRA